MKRVLATLGLVFILTTLSVSAKTAGTVNGMIITVEEANKALQSLTNGKMTWEKLPKAGKEQLMEMMAPSKLVATASQKELTAKEKEVALAGFWMQKKMSKIKVSDKEAKKAYDKMKEASKEAKSKQNIPPFKQVKNSIKMQMRQEKVVRELMKNAKIKVD